MSPKAAPTTPIHLTMTLKSHNAGVKNPTVGGTPRNPDRNQTLEATTITITTDQAVRKYARAE